MIDFWKAIYTFFSATPHNAFYTAIGGRFYYGEAKQGASFPYAVYFGSSQSDEDTFSETIDEVAFQINIYSDKKTSTEAMQLSDYCRELFDGASVTPAGYKDCYIKREMIAPPIKTTGNEWFAALEFMNYLQEE